MIFSAKNESRLLDLSASILLVIALILPSIRLIAIRWTDSPMTSLYLVLIGAILGLAIGYTLTRYGNAWSALLPAGLVFFTIHSIEINFCLKRLNTAINPHQTPLERASCLNDID